jgi:hypothetical protein
MQHEACSDQAASYGDFADSEGLADPGTLSAIEIVESYRLAVFLRQFRDSRVHTDDTFVAVVRLGWYVVNDWLGGLSSAVAINAHSPCNLHQPWAGPARVFQSVEFFKGSHEDLLHNILTVVQVLCIRYAKSKYGRGEPVDKHLGR